MTEEEPELYAVYGRDDSRRDVKEVNYARNGIYDPLDVVYGLYRRQRLWSQQKGWHEDWLYLRTGYCSLKTWNRWVKKATKLKG